MLGALVATALMTIATACGPPKEIKTEPNVTRDPAKLAEAIQRDFDILEAHVRTYVDRYHTLPERLPDLRDTPDGDTILAEIPLDPWRVPYVLRRLDEDVVVLTAGPDLIIGSEDDQSVRISYAGVQR